MDEDMVEKSQDERMAALLGYLQGTSLNLTTDLLERFGVDGTVEEYHAYITDNDMAQCESCGTWVEIGELIEDDEGDGVGCEGCV